MWRASMHIFHKDLDLASEPAHRNLPSVLTVLIRLGLYTLHSRKEFQEPLGSSGRVLTQRAEGNRTGLNIRVTAKQN